MQEIIHSIVAELIPVLSALLTAVATYGVSLLAKRFKVQLNDEHQALLRMAVRKAISGAEEWGARKAGIESRPISGAEKAIWVHNRVQKMFPKLTSDELDSMIDEELGAIKGPGATKDKRIEV